MRARRREGFSLLELLLALVLLQVGLLASAGMIFLAQENLTRARLLTRGVLEAGAVADSLAGLPQAGGGRRARPWGELVWEPAPGLTGGFRVLALGPRPGDTLLARVAPGPLPDSLYWGPDGAGRQ